MWSLKFLSGPKAGKKVLLPKGLATLGREDSCSIRLKAQGISKKHAQITVSDTGLVIEDLKSRNGIFFKGRQIQKQTLKAGDRVALGNIIFEIQEKSLPPHAHSPFYGMAHYPASPGAGPAPQAPQQDPAQKKSIDVKGPLLQNLQHLGKSYVETAVMPGVYKLAEWMEFKFLIGSFVIGFVVLVTTLSAFPLTAILKSSVEKESRNNAETIALNLARNNKSNLQKGLNSAVSVEQALSRPGVKKAYIISSIDGRIMAPAELAHSYPKDPLIHKARKRDQKTVEKSGLSSITAVIPINFYNAETGEYRPKAYSVVVYDTGTLALGGKKITSLVTQTLLIACVLGFLMFFFLINLIEFPIRSLNGQLNKALKDERAPTLSLNYRSSVLTELCGHINSALNQLSLNRMMQEKESSNEKGGEVNRQNEMNNLVEVIGFPALTINLEDGSVAGMNSNFKDQIGFGEALHQPVESIDNSVLKDHLLELLERGRAHPQEMVFGDLTLNQLGLQSSCQFIMGKSAPAYAVVTFIQPEEEAVA